MYRFNSFYGGLLLALVGSAFAAESELSLSVAPNQRMVMEDVSVVVSGGVPNGLVVVEASFEDESQRIWSSRGEYYADSEGRVDVSRDASTGGTYTGTHEDGLIWSMLPFSADELVGIDVSNRDASWPYTPAADDLKPIAITYKASAFTSTTARTPEVVFAEHTIIMKADGVVRTDVTQDDLRGVYFAPSDAKIRGAVLIVTGSGGGVRADVGAWLASKGFAAFAVAHFNYPGRPDELSLQPLEYFQEAAKWLKSEAGVEKVGIMGRSRGGEGALLIASSFPDHVGAVVSLVPSNVAMGGCCSNEAASNSAWTLGGQPLPFPPIRLQVEPADFADPTFLRRFMLDMMVAKGPHEIPVEKIEAPILLISGGADAMWASEAGADLVVDRLQEHQFAFPFQHVSYNGAGHLVGRPSISTALIDNLVHSVTGTVVALGGTPAINATASKKALDEVVLFLNENLSAEF